jgi:hypothetical protein
MAKKIWILNRINNNEIKLVVLVAICLLLFLYVNYRNKYENLGCGYFFDKSQINNIHTIEYSYTEIINQHMNLLEKDGKDILYDWEPGDIILQKIRFNDDYIIVKGEHYERKNELYFWIIAKKEDLIYGPFTDKEFSNIQPNDNLSLLYILRGFIDSDTQ